MKNTHNIIILLASFMVCWGQANALSLRGDVGTKGLDQVAVNEWVRQFYDRCGQTFNVEETLDIIPPWNKGNETVKRCIGDRDGCIEDQDCYFAVSLTERASYDRTDYDRSTPIPEPSSTTEPAQFKEWTRVIESFEVKILDTCHFNPLPIAGESELPEKFVGVGFGAFDSEGKLNCSLELVPSFENFRAFFFVSNFSACDIQTETPLYPYHDANSTINVPTPTTNQFVWNPSDWDVLCSRVKDTISSDANFSDENNNSNFMKYFLLHYYGTEKYSNLGNFTYADNPSFIERKSILRLGPKERVIAGPPPPPPSGSSGLQSTLTIVLILQLAQFLNISFRCLFCTSF